MLELSSWVMDKIWPIGWWRLYSPGSTRLDDKKSKAWARLRLGSGSLSLARAKKIGLIRPLVQITQLDYSGVANNHFGLRDSFEFSRWLLNNWYSVRLGLANCTAVHLYIEAISNQPNKKFVGNFALVIGKVIVRFILPTFHLSFDFWGVWRFCRIKSPMFKSCFCQTLSLSVLGIVKQIVARNELGNFSLSLWNISHFHTQDN